MSVLVQVSSRVIEGHEFGQERTREDKRGQEGRFLSSLNLTMTNLCYLFLNHATKRVSSLCKEHKQRRGSLGGTDGVPAVEENDAGDGVGTSCDAEDGVVTSPDGVDGNPPVPVVMWER